MMDSELWVAARQVEIGQEARRLHLLGEARRLATSERRRRRRPRDWSAPTQRRQPPAPDSRTYWPRVA